MQQSDVVKLNEMLENLPRDVYTDKLLKCIDEKKNVFLKCFVLKSKRNPRMSRG